MINLSKYAQKVYSQYGEDGMIATILDVLGIKQGWCCEFGAWDGIHLSNVYRLVEQGWKGVLIEGDAERFEELKWNMAEFPLVHPHQAYVSIEPGTRLNHILAKYQVPSNFDVLSIDVDSIDYWIWASLTFSPKLVVIEYNCNWRDAVTIPYTKDYAEWDWSQYFGASALALARLGKTKGYELIGCSSYTNLIFLKKGLNQGRFEKIDLSTNEHILENHHKPMSQEQMAALIFNPYFCWGDQLNAGTTNRLQLT